jgi:acetyl-CoA C-acetyltransferase
LSGRVAIVDVAQTKHGAPYIRNLTVSDLVYIVVKELLEKTGISIEDLETIITSSSDFWQGSGCSNVFYFDAAGAYLKDSPKVEEDSALGFVYAFMRILSGHFDKALIVAVTKCSEAPSISDITSLNSDPFYQRPVGIEEVTAAGLQAQQYVSRYKLSDEIRAEIAVKNYRNAINNPYAHRRMNLTIDEVLGSEILAYPLRRLEVADGSDGAVAVLISSEEAARKLTDTPVWIRGVGWSVDHYFLGDRDLLEVVSLREASERAYKMSGIRYPRKQIDLAEVCETSTVQELLWYEGLGFCNRGEGWKLIADGVTGMYGELPVNPSGGVLATNPYVARGLIRVAEATLQLKGEAGRRQVPDAETAIAHSTHGAAGSHHTVIVLGR